MSACIIASSARRRPPAAAAAAAAAALLLNLSSTFYDHSTLSCKLSDTLEALQDRIKVHAKNVRYIPPDRHTFTYALIIVLNITINWFSQTRERVGVCFKVVLY